MKLLRLLICLGLSSVAVAQGVIDPRGVRLVEHGTRSEKCATQKEWPFCTSDEWGPKCPSGCRIQGLMDKYDHTLLKKVEKIRGLLDQNTVKHRSTDEVSKQTYDYLKEKLTTDAGNDNNYYDLAQSLRRRITEMKIKIDKQLRLLAALKDRVKDQVIEMQRLEVDIDIKLRSCKGSCSGYAEYQVDQESYVALDKQIDQLDSRSDQQVETVGTLYVMKSRVLKEELVPSIYKSGITGATAEAQKTEDVFPDVNTLELILEEEGSSSSPATVSKDPGTSYSSSSTSSFTTRGSSGSSSTSHTSSSSITELGGGGGGGDLFGGGQGSFTQPSTSHVSTSTVSKDPGTSYSSSSTSSFTTRGSSDSSSTSHTSSSSITELGGGGGGDLFGGGQGSFTQPSTSHVSTSTVSCTKSIRRTIVHTAEGPVERVEEVIEGGPECQSLKDHSKGSMSAIFPSLSHTSSSSISSSSSSSTKTYHTGGTKGSITGDYKLGSGDPFAGFDVGAFRTHAADDDIPAFHTGSVKTIHVGRQFN